MKKPSPKKRRGERKVKAWAVIQPDMQDSMPFALVFSPTYGFFSEGIFTHEWAAKKMADRFKALKVKVAPCTITYSLPKPNKKK